MAKIGSKVLFLTTSPRTPAKMIPEIVLLNQHFNGQPWNHETQAAFMEILKDEIFFNGRGKNDPAFSARDRINRAPQTLGFVLLRPRIALTPAGVALTTSRRTEEIFLRQLLKFQIPSPYHVPSHSAAAFWIKPYLEIFRLIRHFGTLKFDELKMFALQLTDYRDFDRIVQKIEDFRTAKSNHTGSYRTFVGEYFESELQEIYAEELSSGKIATRESSNASMAKFLQTKGSNMYDYADACFRYLRATGMVNVSHAGKSLSIVPEKRADVDFFLQHTDREPCFVDNQQNYIDYLGDPQLPVLLTDNRESLLEKLHAAFPVTAFDETAGTEELKHLYADLLEQRKQATLDSQVQDLKDYKLYDDIQEKDQQILDGTLYDAPLMLEWNTWRAMTMLDGGNIKANLTFDDFGQPLSAAQGNMADIVCDYGDFGLSVEVTMASGQRQYEMEGEPVARHLGKLRRAIEKPAYCLFIAPVINDACIAHFFMLHKMDLSFYGGRSTIIPLPLNIFQKMVEDSRKANYLPQPQQVKRFFEYSNEVAACCDNERVWYDQIIAKALNWLN